MVKVHERYFIVQNAKLKLSEFLISLIRQEKLTYAEVNHILLEEAMSWNKYAIREERHGDEPKKGDEA
jgi:hypothetical protein